MAFPGCLPPAHLLVVRKRKAAEVQHRLLALVGLRLTVQPVGKVVHNSDMKIDMLVLLRRHVGGASACTSCNSTNGPAAAAAATAAHGITDKKPTISHGCPLTAPLRR